MPQPNYKFKIGSRVIDRYGESGTVARRYSSWHSKPGDDFVSMTKAEWLQAQTVPFTSKELEEPWYSVDLDNGGSILSCQSQLSTPKPEEV